MYMDWTYFVIDGKPTHRECSMFFLRRVIMYMYWTHFVIDGKTTHHGYRGGGDGGGGGGG